MFNNRKLNINSLFFVLHTKSEPAEKNKMKISLLEHNHNKLNHYELHYKISGSAKVTFQSKTFDYKEGSLLYLPKATNASYFSSSLKTDDGSEQIIIFFDTDTPMPEEAFMWDISGNEALKNLFEKIDKNWKGWDTPETNYYLCMSILYQIIYEMSLVEKSVSASKISAALEYLDANFTDSDIVIETLCKKYKMSHSHFKRLFIKHTGMTPKAYLQKKRMEYAKELIKENKMSISNVAKKSGFSNASYFSRAYKKYFGVSPKNS